jgi:hypothetical protein
VKQTPSLGRRQQPGHGLVLTSECARLLGGESRQGGGRPRGGARCYGGVWTGVFGYSYGDDNIMCALDPCIYHEVLSIMKESDRFYL